jgi:glutathione-regulated potassium-efflux system ancillary protein KefC
MRGAVFGGGALQLGLSGAALAAGGLVAGLPLQAAIVAGLALALSSTAIAMQSMSERNLTPTPSGRKAFAILLFQDIAAIPLLAAIPRPRTRALTESCVATGGEGRGGGRRPRDRALPDAPGAADRRGTSSARSHRVCAAARHRHRAPMNWPISMALGAFSRRLLASSGIRHALETDIEPFKGCCSACSSFPSG